MSKVTPLRFGRSVLPKMDLRPPRNSHGAPSPPESHRLPRADTVGVEISGGKEKRCRRTCYQEQRRQFDSQATCSTKMEEKIRSPSLSPATDSFHSNTSFPNYSRPLIAAVLAHTRVFKGARKRRRSFATRHSDQTRGTYGDVREAWLRYVTRAPGSVTKRRAHARSLAPPPRCASSSNIFPSLSALEKIAINVVRESNSLYFASRERVAEFPFLLLSLLSFPPASSSMNHGLVDHGSPLARIELHFAQATRLKLSFLPNFTLRATAV